MKKYHILQRVIKGPWGPLKSQKKLQYSWNALCQFKIWELGEDFFQKMRQFCHWMHGNGKYGQGLVTWHFYVGTWNWGGCCKVKWKQQHWHYSFDYWWGIQAQRATKIPMDTFLSNLQVYSRAARAEKNGRFVPSKVFTESGFLPFLAARSAPEILVSPTEQSGGIYRCVNMFCEAIDCKVASTHTFLSPPSI